MQTYLVKRALSIPLALVGVSILVFLLLRLIPGDVVDQMLGAQNTITETQRQSLRTFFGLDQPLYVQYWNWARQVVVGNLGASFRTSTPVLSLVADRLPVTAELTLLSMLVGLAIGIPTGVIAAVRRNGSLDHAARVVSLFGLSIPEFWQGTIAGSGRMLGHAEVRFVRAAEGGADALDQLGGRQQPRRLGHAALAVPPLGLDGVEPRALDRQVAAHDPHPGAGVLDPAVVLLDPGADFLADVPGGVVPDQQQRRLARRPQPGAAPGEILGRERADRAAVDEAQPGLLLPAARPIRPARQQPVAGQRLGVRVALGDRPLDQPQRPIPRRPRGQRGLRQAAPPDLALEAEGPVGAGRRQADQAVAGAFFRAYPGSGLVIQRLARFQPTPRRLRVMRIVSSLTRCGVSPCSKPTSAASSRVHRPVGLPKSRGLRCSSPRSRAARSGSKARWIVLARFEPGRSAAGPRALKACSALRTVCSPQPSCRAIAATGSPRALASTIWLRRSVKASGERSPASACRRSESVIGRTKMGCRIPPAIRHSPPSVLGIH